MRDLFRPRRGSDLRKIVNKTEKLPGYTEELRPEFHSSGTDFRVMLKNVNFNMHGSDQDTMHDAMHDERINKLVDACAEPKTREEMMEFLGLANRDYFRKAYLKPLHNSSRIKMTIPDKLRSKTRNI